MKLLTILKKKPFCYDLIYFLIAIIIFILSIKYPLFYILLGIIIIYIFIKKRRIIIPILALIMIFLIRITISLYINNISEMDEYTYYVSDIKDDNSYYAYIDYKKVLIYDYNNTAKPGDIIKAKISFYENDLKSYDTDFDNEYYLKSIGVIKSGRVYNTKIINNTFSIYSIKYYYSNYLKDNLSSDSYNYVSALVFGNNNLDKNIKDSYSILGISHVLAISGMHIIFLFNIISFILLKLFHYYKKLIPILIISIFVILIGAPLSSIRAVLFLIIGGLNTGRKRYNKLDILSISCLLMLIINPYYLFNTGFILSFLVSFILIIKDYIFINSKYKLINTYKLYILIFLITLPFVINISNRISILSILLSPILSTIIGYILLPISYILAILPILDYVFKYIYIFINMYLINLGNLLPIIHLRSFNVYMIIFYYLIFCIFIIGIYKGRWVYYFIMLISYLIMIYSIRYIDSRGRITFIDCGQGDSAIIELPYSKGIMVIDCFNSIDYLKAIGINNIDYLVITHSDNDHTGDYKEIIEEFNVKNIFYPKYDERFNTLLEGYNNIYPITDLSKINNQYFNVDILGPINKYDDPNSNSIVLKIKIYNTSILFTGDMTEKEEYDVINKYKNNLKSDILKVAHHGSNTSSTNEFIKYVNPKDSVISVGLNNSYNLPNKEIVNRINKYSNIYLTKDLGNIDLYIYKDHYDISGYRKKKNQSDSSFSFSSFNLSFSSLVRGTGSYPPLNNLLHFNNLFVVKYEA